MVVRWRSVKFVLGCGVTAMAMGAHAAPGDAVWLPTLVDDFDGPAGTLPDASVWNIETGGNGWGNNELQTYTTSPDNVSLDGQGNLAITAREGWTQGTDGIWRQYTSARITTQGNFSQTYGRFEARLDIPVGQGVWPAFWMLGEDIASQGWPLAGEIDIMENIGSVPGTVHGTIHGPGYAGGDGIGASYNHPGGQAFGQTFHTFAVEWTPGRIDWFVDGNLFQTLTPNDLGGDNWVFDDDFFLLLNVAVGGNWPGAPDGSTSFPQQMLVDYVAVYERAVETRTQLQSGQFNQNNDAWLLESNSYIQTHDPGAGPSQIALNGEGDAALKLFGSFDNASPETQTLQSFMAVAEGQTHLFSAAVRTNSDDSIADTSNRLELFVAFYDGYNRWLGEQRIVALDSGSEEDTWQYIDFEFTPLAGAAYADIGFRFVQPGLEGGAAWVDNVRFGLLSEIGLTGDLDGDGVVGVGDLDLLLANWGQAMPGSRLDADGDGVIGEGDLAVVQATFGRAAPTHSTVPVPGSAALLAVSALTMGMRRRQC